MDQIILNSEPVIIFVFSVASSRLRETLFLLGEAELPRSKSRDLVVYLSAGGGLWCCGA